MAMTEQRPNYAPDARVLPTRVIDGAAFAQARLKPSSRRFTLANLRVRLTLNIIAISFVVLVLMGAIIAITGVVQVHSAQNAQSRQALDAVKHFAASVEGSRSERAATSTYDVMYGFLARAPREGYTSVVGFIDGQPRLYQSGQNDAVVANADLMGRIGQDVKSATRAGASTLRVSGHEYRVTIVPLTVVGASPGAIVVISDVDQALAPTLNLVRIFAGVSLVVLSLVALVTWAGMSRILKPLAQLRAMTRSVATADDLTQRLPVSSSDDLGDLACSFNDMVNRLQTVFEEQRHLLNDAGHELRTPLTVVQGHLELMDPNDPRDASHTRGLVLEEVSRMHRMSEDLIDVARASTPNFVRPEPTSLTELTLDVLQHAAQLGSQRFVLDHLGEADLVADPQRLSQAMLQLAENATKFSSATSRIYIGSGVNIEPEMIGPTGRIIPTTPIIAPGTHRPTGEWVSLWVRDEGIGVEPRNATRIFDRFARVDHATPGSGLGLTIVSAIAAAHSGSLELRSAPGEGSVFALFIPLEAPRAVQEGTE